MAWMSVLYTHPPVVVDSGHGGGFTDVDGNAYLDFNLADTSMFTGYGVEAITRAVSERTAAGSQSCCPRRMRLKSPAGSRTGSECRSGSSRYRRRWPTPRRCA